MAIMFPFRQPTTSQPAPRKEWRPTGFFNQYNPQGYAKKWRNVKSFHARLWLEAALMDGPLPAAMVLKLAKAEGIPLRGLYRAKRHHKVKSVRMGGKGTGRRNPWIWQLSVSK